MIYIALYLIAIVAANLMVSTFGASVSVLNAFLFIGLDLTARDRLHDAWHNRHLIPKMTLLIASGSILSAILNRNAANIALASFVAFMAAGVVDTITYVVLRSRSRFARVNGSNVLSAGVDSLIFPALAFGLPLMWGIVAGQFVAKVLGGFIWSIIFRRSRTNRTPD